MIEYRRLNVRTHDVRLGTTGDMMDAVFEGFNKILDENLPENVGQISVKLDFIGSGGEAEMLYKKNAR